MIFSVVLSSNLIKSAWSNLVLSPSIELFVSFIAIFNSSFCFHFMFSASSLIFPFWSYIIFLTSCTFFPLFLWISLKQLSLSNRFAIRSFSGTLSVDVLLSLQWAIISCFSKCSVILVENWTFESKNVDTMEIRFSFPRVCYIFVFVFIFLFDYRRLSLCWE